jgi:hypothetical protein
VIVVFQCKTVDGWVHTERLTHSDALATVSDADLLRVKLHVINGQIFLDLIEIILIIVVHAIAGSLLAFLLLFLLLPSGFRLGCWLRLSRLLLVPGQALVLFSGEVIEQVGGLVEALLSGLRDLGSLCGLLFRDARMLK